MKDQDYKVLSTLPDQEMLAVLRTAGFKDLNQVGEESISVCIECGCDDLHACYDEVEQDACHWVRLDTSAGQGVCSACREHAERWDAGDREIAVPVEPHHEN